MCTGSKGFGLCLTEFSSQKQGAESEAMLLKLKPASIWDPGLSKMSSATMLLCWDITKSFFLYTRSQTKGQEMRKNYFFKKAYSQTDLLLC